MLLEFDTKWYHDVVFPHRVIIADGLGMTRRNIMARLIWRLDGDGPCIKTMCLELAILQQAVIDGKITDPQAKKDIAQAIDGLLASGLFKKAPLQATTPQAQSQGNGEMP